MRQKSPSFKVGDRFGNWVADSDVLERDHANMRLMRVSCEHKSGVLIRYDNIINGKSTGCMNCRGDGMSHVPRADRREYKLLLARWFSIKARCSNPEYANYPNYGARGIRMSPEFDTFKAFMSYVKSLSGYDLSLQIDRINNMGHYEPGNLRWATRIENSRNTRKNVFVEYDGRRMTVAEFIPYTTLSIPYVQRLIRDGVPPLTIVNMRSSRAAKTG